MIPRERRSHELADIDGDRRFEIASAGCHDGARRIDPRDGKVLWALAAPAAHRSAAAGIDGKPGDELLYVASYKLVAVSGGREKGRVLWTWRGPAALCLPAIAGSGGDGRVETIVHAADGTVHCVE